MAAPARRLILPLLIAASLALAERAIAQAPVRDPLGAARDLYASARYDEALAVLDDIPTQTNQAGAPERKSVEQYRSLCLLALGRGSEAENAIAAVVTADPTYQPKEEEASPRVRTAFSDVRKRVLPEIAASRYAEAKASYDKKMFAVAAQQFKQVIALLDDPDMSGRQTDLRTLASGFLDLAIAASAPPPPPPAPPKPVVSVPAPPPPAPKPDPLHIYSISDKDVTPPVTIRQDMPPLLPNMRQQAHDQGVVEIVVNEQGRVDSAIIRRSIQPMFDTQLLAAVREWRYQPATASGVAVKYRKMIQINVTGSR